MTAEDKVKNAQKEREGGINLPKDRKMRSDGAELTTDRRGNWFSRWATPLVVGLALSCGSAVSDDSNADAGDDTVQVDDGEEDTPDIFEDADTLDEGTEDCGPDADADADVEDTTDEGGILDDAGAEEDAGCTESRRIVPERISGPGMICGSTQTTTTETEVVTFSGPGCETTEPIHTRVRVVVELTPPLDTSALACARASTIRALNGPETIVDLTEEGLDSAGEVNRGVDLSIGQDLDGGAEEPSLHIRNILGSEVNVRVDSSSGEVLIPGLTIYNTGHADILTLPRAAIAWDITDSETSLAIIEQPTERTNGSIEYWTAGDRAPFDFYTNVMGDQLHGWEWVRE